VPWQLTFARFLSCTTGGQPEARPRTIPCGPRLAPWPPGPHQSPDTVRRNRHDVALMRS
jgi:hypothetical protein